MVDRPRVAVLGAGGFIGYRFTEWLLLRKLAHVRPIVRSFRGLARLARFNLDSRIADVTDSPGLERQLEGCDTLVHCVVGDRRTILEGLESTYRAAERAGVRRLVYLSSSVVHGHRLHAGIHEAEPLEMKQPFEYNVSKVLAELKLAEMQGGRMETVILRPCIVHGPRSVYWTAGIATDLLEGRAWLYDGGQGVCNTVHIDNLVSAIWLAATRTEAAGQAFFVTDGERITWKEFYSSVASAIGIDPAMIPNLSPREVRRKKNAAFAAQQWAALLPRLKKAGPLGRMIRGRLLMGSRLDRRLATPIDMPDSEIISLQQCRHILPQAKAEALLGYRPILTFAEGAARTAAWLKFVSIGTLD